MREEVPFSHSRAIELFELEGAFKVHLAHPSCNEHLKLDQIA